MADDTPRILEEGELPPGMGGKPPDPGVPPIDLSDLPTDPGELHEHLRQVAIRVTAKTAAVADRVVDQLAMMDLSGANPRDLATTLNGLAKRLGEVSTILAEIAPRNIHMTMRYPRPTKDKKCVICGAEKPLKDITGFDDIGDEE